MKSPFPTPASRYVPQEFGNGPPAVPAVQVTVAGTWFSGMATASVPSVYGIVPGMSVSGLGIASGTTVLSVDDTYNLVYLSLPTTTGGSSVPLIFTETSEYQALCGMIDRICGQLSRDLGRYCNDRYNPESCPVGLLTELAATIGVVVLDSDTEAQKRAKIYNGISEQKYNSTWQQSAKPAIDSITGASSSLYSTLQSDWPIQVQDETWFNQGYPWSLISGGGDGYGGIIQVGGAVESIIAGIVYIDVGTGAPVPANEVAQIVAALSPGIVPAYFRIFLGYTVAGGWNQLAQIG
jgi:hypothetical protein